MMIIIQNSHLTVEIDPMGAQLKSIHANGREYLWQGDPASWDLRAPILFPVIGRMRGGIYTVDGVEYQIPSHGFAKSTMMEASNQSETAVTFSMTDSPETHEMYPYEFRFSVSFTLDGNTIHKTHSVENLGNGAMYYEVGGHDGFSVPFSDAEKMMDCHIRIPEVDTITPYAFDEAVTLQLPDRDIVLEDGLLPLTPSTYGLDSVIVKNLPVRRAELLDGVGAVRLALEFEQMDYVTFWTRTCDFDTNFVCIEPWTSLPDAAFVGREISEKAGIRKLEQGQCENIGYDIIVY